MLLVVDVCLKIFILADILLQEQELISLPKSKKHNLSVTKSKKSADSDKMCR
uniref:Uncharacterized protein n=1 Tax=Octopus bimaculoides TaxID=37653 RepID=A0A0L8HNW0_OCTBM